MRDALNLGTALLVFVVVVGPARAGGGFTQSSWGSATVVLSAFVLVLLLTREIRLGRLEMIAAGALLLLGLWTALSLLWTVSVPLTMLELERWLLPFAALVAALFAVRPDTAWQLALGVCGAALAIAGWALIVGVDRPLGYANALALLCVMGALLVAGWAVERGDRVSIAVAAPMVAGFAVVVVQSQSRGAVLALLGGAAVAVAMRLPRPGPATFGTLAVAGATIAAFAIRDSPQRSAYWSVTWHAAARMPFLGSGAGTWRRTWLADRHLDLAAANAHSLVMEVLSELGVVGLTLVVGALLVPIAAAVRARRQRFVPAITAAYAAFLLHLGVDWDWQISPVAVAGVFLGGALLASARGRTRSATRAVPHGLALGAATFLFLAGSLVWAGGVLSGAAQEHLRSAAWSAAERDALRARWFEPWSSEPWRLRGQAQLAQGRRAEAAASFRRGLALDPGDAQLWRLLAGVSSGEELRRARDRVAELDPRGLEPEG